MARLLFVAPDARFLVSHRFNLIIAALAQGHEVVVAAPDGPAVEQIVAAGARHVAVPIDRGSKNPLREIGSFLAIASALRAVRPDLVHLISPKPTLYGGIAARILGVPSIAAISGLGHAFVNRSLFGRLLRRGVSLAYRAAINGRRSTIIFQNNDDLGTFRSAGLLRHDRHVLIAGSGTDLRAIAPKPLPAGPPVVILPARMLGDKGVYEFVEAARILRGRGVEAVFRLVGDPDPSNPTSVGAPQLQAWVAEGVVEWVPHTHDIAGELASAHIVALPSYREGFPKTLIDAAAAGRAAVATDVAGCRDAVVGGVTGILCLPRDARSLADALQKLIRDPALQARMGAAARRHAEAHFDVDKVTLAHLALYAAVTGTTTRPAQ